MRLSRHLFEDQNFVLTRIRGTLRDSELIRHAAALRKGSGSLPEEKHLVDFREVSCLRSLSVRGATEYAKQEPVRPDGVLALLLPKCKLSFGMARAYQTFAQDKRRKVQIFQDVDSAIEWLFGHDQQAMVEPLQKLLDVSPA